MYHILLNSDLNIVQKKLAPLIVNNFYCNYLSGNYIDNNLLYLITMMLKEEIDKLENINQVDKFLENTKCGYLLEEFRNMPDVQIYFKNVIYNLVEKMERTCSFKEINFNVSEIIKELNKSSKKEDKINNKNLDEVYETIINDKLIEPSINYFRRKNDFIPNNNDIFMSKYVAEINIKEFEKFAEKAKKENKNDLYNYFVEIINGMKKNDDKNLYSNTILMKNLINTKLATYMLYYYKTNFLEIISFIKELTENIMKNILLLPNSIKYICKIISLLIKNKFKDITKTEENAFISQFIIGKLLIPILSFPSQYAYISEFIISGNTIKNIKVLNYILKKLFSGKLFYNNPEEANFTPFNWHIIDEMENILYFYEKSKNVKLPDFIEKYINEKLPEDYIYDFFEENKEEFCANISICFNVDNLFCLVKGLEKSDIFLQNKNNSKINKLKRAFNKLKSESTKKEIIKADKKNKKDYKDKMNENEQKNKEEKNKYYYLYNEIINPNKYNNFFSINNKIAYFYINLKKIQKNKILDENEKNIIKIKNYLWSSLGNFRLLNKSDFNIDVTSNTKKMLNEIKNYMSLPNFILNNNTIPSIWYINSILNYLNKIPEDYRKNDYEKLFNELIKNLNDSINELDFEKLILFRNKLKFLDKMNNYYEKLFKLKNNIVINENIKRIAEDAFIPVDISFKYDDEGEKYFKLQKSKLQNKDFEDKIIYEGHKKKSFKTIEVFTRYFPNLNIYQELQDKNPLDIIKELSINEQIITYFEIIKEKAIKKNVIELKKYDSLYSENIKDYIMNKIYDKIYPLVANDKDNQIFQKTIELSWVEPQLIIKKDYIFDNVLPDILNEFKQINIVKNPFKKLNSIRKIMEYVNSLIKFNEGEDKEIGADDITPVLNYVFIKAKPLRIFSDIEFTKLFCENGGQFENSLVNFESICLVIINSSNKNFNLSSEEYKQKCEEARINNINSL